MDCFISYRRDDTEGYAGWLSDLLRSPTGGIKASVFLDVDDIAPGENFVRDMLRAVREADVVLALVGPRWVRKSLKDEDDAVRLELAAALEYRVPMRVLLVAGAERPPAHVLPASLQGLSRVSAHVLREQSFDADVVQLMTQLQREITPKPRRTGARLCHLLVVHANPGFWTNTSSIPIRLDGRVLGEFSLAGGQARFDIPPGRHRINAGKGLFVSADVEFEGAAGETVRLVVHHSALGTTRCVVEPLAEGGQVRGGGALD